MLNNFILLWLSTIIILNIIIRLFVIYKNKYIFSFTVDKFYNINGEIISYFIRFNSFKFYKNNHITILKTIIDLINNNEIILNHNYYITFFKYNNKSLIAISNPYFIKYDLPINHKILANNILWTDIAFRDNNFSDVVVMIKLIK